MLCGNTEKILILLRRGKENGKRSSLKEEIIKEMIANSYDCVNYEEFPLNH